MIHSREHWDGRKLLRDGWSDEDVERLAGLDLHSILLLRAEAASAASDRDPRCGVHPAASIAGADIAKSDGARLPPSSRRQSPLTAPHALHPSR